MGLSASKRACLISAVCAMYAFLGAYPAAAADDPAQVGKLDQAIETDEAVTDTLTESEVTASLSQAGSWSDGTDSYYQYDVVVTNGSGEQIRDWELSVDVADDTAVSQLWNCTCSVDAGVLTLVPADYANILEAGGSSQGIGLIVTTADPAAWDSCRITYTKGNETGIKTRWSSAAEGNTAADRTAGDGVSALDTDGGNAADKENGAETASGAGIGDEDSSDSSAADERTAAEERTTDMPDHVKVWKAEDGMSVPWLHVDGTLLTDGEGNAIRLQGISTHGLGVFPEYVSEESFRSLRDEFGANVMRLAMYTQAENGYCETDDAGKQAQETLIDQGVQACRALGMYVIIDWHILSDGNPLTHADEAEEFFSRMSERYGDVPNVIFEICNEPNGSSWEQEIMPYADRIIPVIREHAPKSLILVGTDNWSQYVDEPAADPLKYDNLMYCLHFYAATHKEDLRNKLTAALDQGTPVFISECSICDADGNGSVDYDSAEAWKQLITERGLSYIEWNLSNKNEASAMVLPSCAKLSGWTVDELSETALWYRAMMRGLAGLE